MKFLNDLITKPKLFQRTVGLSTAQFKMFTSTAEKAWSDAEFQRKMVAPRKRAIGAGRPYKLKPLEQKILMTLVYYKAYFTQEFLGFLIGLDQANVSRLLTKTRGIIEQIADPELKTYLAQAKSEYDLIRPQDRVSSWDAFTKKYPDLQEASSDATEQQTYRSHINEVQKEHYSGKKKLHTLKTQISVSKSGRILDVSGTYPGSIHDKKVIDQEQTVQKFPEQTPQLFDSGYQGVPKDNPHHDTATPMKKPKNKELSLSEKESNKELSKKRVIVENVLSRLKKFKICKYTFRGPIETYNQTFRNIAAILNFRLRKVATA